MTFRTSVAVATLLRESQVAYINDFRGHILRLSVVRVHVDIVSAMDRPLCQPVVTVFGHLVDEESPVHTKLVGLLQVASHSYLEGT